MPLPKRSPGRAAANHAGLAKKLGGRASQYPPELGGVTGVIGDQPVSCRISALT